MHEACRESRKRDFTASQYTSVERTNTRRQSWLRTTQVRSASTHVFAAWAIQASCGKGPSNQARCMETLRYNGSLHEYTKQNWMEVNSQYIWSTSDPQASQSSTAVGQWDGGLLAVLYYEVLHLKQHCQFLMQFQHELFKQQVERKDHQIRHKESKHHSQCYGTVLRTNAWSQLLQQELLSQWPPQESWGH